MNLSEGSARRAPAAHRKYLFLARIGVAVILLASLIWFAGLENLQRTLSALDPALAMLCVLVIVVFFLLGSVNVWWLLRCRYQISFSAFLRSYAHGFSLGLLLPGQIGDATLVLFLRNASVPIRISGAAYTMDKVITLSVLSCVAIFGLQRFGVLDFSYVLAIIAAIASLIVLGLLILTHRAIDNRPIAIIRTLLEEISGYRNHIGAVFGNLLLTLVKWMVMGLSYYLAFRTFGTLTPWPDIGIIPVMSTLVGYIPISIGGIGTVELSAVVLFKMLGIAEATVISVYILLRSIHYVMAAILVGVLHREPAKSGA